MAFHSFARAGPSISGATLVEATSRHGSTNFNTSGDETPGRFQGWSSSIYCGHGSIPRAGRESIVDGVLHHAPYGKAQRSARASHGQCCQWRNVHDKNSSTSPKSPGWLALRTMEHEINHLLSRAESKFRTPNGGKCTSKAVGLLVRRHIVSGEFHYIGKEASTRWAGGPDFSMMAEAGLLDTMDETSREYERVVDAKYLDDIRAQANQFSTKRLSRKAALAESTIRNFKNGKNTIRPRSLRKLTKAIHDLQNKKLKS